MDSGDRSREGRHISMPRLVPFVTSYIVHFEEMHGRVGVKPDWGFVTER